MNRLKVTGVFFLVFVFFMGSRVFGDMPDMSVVIGTKGYSLEYANRDENREEIKNALKDSKGIVFIKRNGIWYKNDSALADIKDIPKIIYKDSDGNIKEYYENDGLEIVVAEVMGAKFRNNWELLVEFNKSVSKESAENCENYEIQGENINEIKEVSIYSNDTVRIQMKNNFKDREMVTIKVSQNILTEDGEKLKEDYVKKILCVKPISLKAVYENDNVKLKWIDEGYAEGYNLYKEDQNGKFQLLKDNIQENYYIDLDVKDDTSFSYKIEARYKGLKAGTSYEKVQVPVTGVSIDKKNLTLSVGEKERIQWAVIPSNAYKDEFTWSSSDKSVATIDEFGIVSAEKKGKAIITAKTGYGEYSVCNVTVLGKEVPKLQGEYKDGEVELKWSKVPGAEAYNIYTMYARECLKEYTVDNAFINVTTSSNISLYTKTIKSFAEIGMRHGSNSVYVVKAVCNGQETSISNGLQIGANYNPEVEIWGLDGDDNIYYDKFISVYGSASDDVGLAKIIYEVNGDYRGEAHGTDSWHIENLKLNVGRNSLTVTAIDISGHRTSTKKIIIYDNKPYDGVKIENLRGEFSEESQEKDKKVIFKADVVSDQEKNIVRVRDEKGSIVCILLDDGKGADEKAGDGVYSGEAVISSENDNGESYYATLFNKKSEKVVLDFNIQ